MFLYLFLFPTIIYIAVNLLCIVYCVACELLSVASSQSKEVKEPSVNINPGHQEI